MAKIKFQELNFQRATLDVIAKADQITREYASQGYRMTLRQLYYQFIGRDAFGNDWIDTAYNLKHHLDPKTKNTLKNYKKLAKIVSDARLAGLIDWNAIVDRGRTPTVWAQFDNIRELIDDAVRSYRLPRWADQPKHVELWVEKDALASVLEPIASDFHVSLVVNKGYSSQSAMYEASKRFRAAEKECVLLYLGDHDPSGEDMVRDITERMEMFGVRDLTVEKVALTMAQVREHELPPNPAKDTDPRAGKYIEEHGDESWEVDALDTPVLVELIEEAVENHIDREAYDEVIEQEEKDTEKLERIVKKAFKDHDEESGD